MMSDQVIELREVTRQFGDVVALDKTNLTVAPGEWLAIMGPSGSGKTTLLNILSCLDTPSAGVYLLDGIDVSSLTDRERTRIRREKIGLIFQQFHLIPYLSAVENVMLAQHYHSVVDKEEGLLALERVGLAHRADHLPTELSGGEQQRVCIARALINDPALILADEPTGNLDEGNEESVLELFRTLHQSGRTLVIVTHNTTVSSAADRCIHLENGKIKGTE